MSVLEYIPRVIANNPRKMIVCTLAASLVVILVDWLYGNFQIDMQNRGWKSRGTLIGKRAMQASIFWKYRKKLLNDENGEFWDYLISTTIDGYFPIGYNFYTEALNARSIEADHGTDRRLEPSLQTYFSSHHRMMNESKFDSIPFECDSAWYNSDWPGLKRDNLNAIWKVDGQKSILDADIISQICDREQSMLTILQNNGLCDDCIDGKCLPPSSLVSLFRSYIGGNVDMNCQELSNLYIEYKSSFSEALSRCVAKIRQNHDPIAVDLPQITECLPDFQGHMIDQDFDVGDNYHDISLSASSFPIPGTLATKSTILYHIRDTFPSTDPSLVTVRYDMNYRVFYEFYSGKSVNRDLAFAFASSAVTVIAILIHTKSVWLTVLGLLQIFLASPWAYFVYHFILGISFFPILNLIAVFISAALGADDLFVATDKWKNSRLETPTALTADIAIKTLPDAAGAMLLTTITTVIAFFGTAICPVAPIFCFAIFCGVTITFNYVLNCLFVFPALCLYDGWLQHGSENFLISFRPKQGSLKDLDSHGNDENELHQIDENVVEEVSSIRRILLHYYNVVHKFRKHLFVLSLAIMSVSTFFGSQIPEPKNNIVNLLPSKNEYQQFDDWSFRLFETELINSQGSAVDIFWGILPKDTGQKENPDILSKLSLDDDFDPSSEEAQIYLLHFCERLYDADFYKKPGSDLMCPLARFNEWLKSQSSLPLVDQDPEYLNVCKGANALPISREDFHACIIHYSKDQSDNMIISHPVEKKVKIIQIEARSSALFTDTLGIVGAEYKKFEDFFRSEAITAPIGVNSFFHTSPTWWWYDTSKSMQFTALTAAAIALGFSAFLVFLVSKSFRLTLFATSSILFVLSMTSATLVVFFSWSLGLLESICFAILIGISCDFVIHLSHSYFRIPGVAEPCKRTKMALIHMGPSVLASAATTFFSAVLMLFCQMTFFPLFAEMLLFTIIYAVLGSMVVYVVLADLFGPSDPNRHLKLSC